MLADSDLPLFNWTPPNEETPEKFKRAPGDPRDFTAEWDELVRTRWSVAESIERHALRLLAEGVRRISVDDLFNEQRRMFGASLDNNHRAACGRWLIVRNPGLDGVVRTRRTTRTR